ncbi:MAG: zinc ribbon domain-containing protein [Candidatus Omnitrophica bacterium]|nr:zinc ribbon domain-containing protein [Candidatus Omnitrophota bacterium]
MPTYEYRCLKCRRKFERLQRITEPPLGRCVFCKGKAERLISAGVGLIFKGSGFYSTDYKKKPKDAVKSVASEPKAASPKEPKTESTPKKN